MDLKSHKIWVNHRNKIPHMPNGRPASSTDPSTWSTYEEVKKVSDNVGFVIDPSLNIFAIDLDKCLDENKKMKNEAFRQLIEDMDTYTEVSPSGTGLHMICICEYEVVASRSARCPGIEIYNHGRYFTYTNNVYGGRKAIRVIEKKEMDSILAKVGYPWGIVTESNDKVVEVGHTLDDEALLKRMFAAKNGKEIEALWNGDVSAYGGDDSAGDMALCMHLAFWTQRDHERVRQLWLSSPLGQRKKTQERGDYQERTVKRAIEGCKEVYTPPREKNMVVETPVGELELLCNSKGRPYVSAENVYRIAKNDPTLSTMFRFNSFISDYETKYLEKEWRPLQKVHIISAMMYLQKTYGGFETVPQKTVEDGLIKLAYEMKINPAQEYFKSLEWDRVSRLDTWLVHAYGVEDNEYHQSVGSNWLKGLAKRVMKPGCKFDYVLVLEGEQGMKKSTSLSVLGSPYHVETVLSPDNKDFFMILAKNIIVEFSEGETLARAEMKKLKAVITMLEDEYRVPYDRGITKAPRHCVFAMTTNQDEYLKDETGNRRWLPVTVMKEADIEWIKANREQLLAEANYRANVLNETTWEFSESAADEQNKRMVADPYQEKVVDWYINLSETSMNEGVTTTMAYESAYGSTKELQKAISMTLASLFKNVLKLEKKRTMVGGVQCNRWYPSENTPKAKTQVKLEDLVKF